MAKEETQTKPGSVDHSAFRPGATRIGAAFSFNGTLEGRDDAIIEGRFQGKIILPSSSLTIARGAKVEADIQVRSLILQGELTGAVTAAERVAISETARMDGDIQTATISVSNGARFKGTIKIEKG
jgi:cytoskeletal protein CcmA (bactofilin family)